MHLKNPNFLIVRLFEKIKQFEYDNSDGKIQIIKVAHGIKAVQYPSNIPFFIHSVYFIINEEKQA